HVPPHVAASVGLGPTDEPAERVSTGRSCLRTSKDTIFQPLPVRSKKNRPALSTRVFEVPAIVLPSARNRALANTIAGRPLRSSRTVVAIVDGRGEIAAYAAPAAPPPVLTPPP